MFDYLKADAADEYLQLTIISRRFGIIGQTIFLERLSVLAEIGPRGDAVTFYARSVLDRDGRRSHGDDWYEEASDQNGDAENFGPLQSVKSIDSYGVVHFKVTFGELKNWFFHPYDADFFPSVPHGHFENRDDPKLDPYLGWKYHGSMQSGRIKRKTIVELWNDEGFRVVAAKAIDYYLVHHQSYGGWRVPNPRRLPQRRKF